MSIRFGITNSEFWSMSPKILNIYRKEYEKNTQSDADMIDYQAWLNGLYVFKAINAALSKRGKYLSERIGLNSKEKYEDSSIASVKFGEWAKAFNKTMKRGE